MNLRALVLLPCLAVPLAGCQTETLPSLTPQQDAQLLCLGAVAAGQLSNAKVQADGTVLCTLATGAAIVVTPPLPTKK